MKAVIFDVDGTLVDSVDLHAKSWQETFEHFGHSFRFDEIRSQIGKGGDQLMPVFLSEEEVHSKGEEIEKYRAELFKKKFLHLVKPFPQVRALFEKILHDDWKIALASSAKGDELETYKKISQISDLLDTETSSDDADRSKPHPDIFQAAIKRLGQISPQDCVVIGDSPYDAEAASKAGIRSVAFLCGGFPEEQLQKAGFEQLYRDAADLLRNYERSLLNQERPHKL